MNEITALAGQIYAINVEKGFWDKERNVGEAFMLIISELAEAIEAHRKRRFSSLFDKDKMTYLSTDGEERPMPCLTDTAYPDWFRQHVKDSFEDEIADAYIRALDCAHGFKVKLEKAEPEYRDVDMQNVGDRLIDICEDFIAAKNLLRRWEPAGRQMMTAIEKLKHLAADYSFDLELHARLKMAYNATRERLHGKAY